MRNSKKREVSFFKTYLADFFYSFPGLMSMIAWYFGFFNFFEDFSVRETVNVGFCLIGYYLICYYFSVSEVVDWRHDVDWRRELYDDLAYEETEILYENECLRSDALAAEVLSNWRRGVS